jgi:DNA-binding MarR family transcriptional regulator
MLKRMEAHGTISREADPEDQRVARVRLTAAGREQERRLRAILGERLGEVLDPLPEVDRDELARLLDALAERMAAALGEAAAGAGVGPAAGERRR